MGADDYVVKPFSPREVVSRVEAVLRRTHAPPPEPETFAEHTVTVQGPFFMVSLQERQITVSRTELRLLRYMLARAGELIRGEDLLNLPGEHRGNIAPEELDHRVRFLRRKLDNSGAGSIEMLPGSRYRFLAQPRPG